MDQIRPEDQQYDTVYENRLSKNIGFLQYTQYEKVHHESFECPKLLEKGNPTFHHVKTVKRSGFSLEAIAKVYELPRDERIIDDVRAGNDVKARCLISPYYCFMLKVYDCSRYCVIYEHYLYNLEEVCQLQIKNHNVRPHLGRLIIDFVRGKQFIVESDNYRTTPFFREFMEHTLKFLAYLHARNRAYGGLHPHNILIVDDECTIKFKGLKDIDHINGAKPDLDDFVRLVRFCVHGGGRDINNTNNDGNICKEAKEFLSIFVLDQNGTIPRSRPHYILGFKKNRLSILKHPLFWDASICMNYFLQTHALLVACDLTWKKFELGSSMKVFQQKLHPNIYKARRDLLAVNVESPYTHTPGDVIDHIITIIRNMEGHFPDGLDGRDRQFGYLGSHPDEFWSNFRKYYPGLITGVHKVMISYTKLISPLFRSHWEKFYPDVC